MISEKPKWVLVLSLSLSQKKQKKLRKCDAKLRKRAPERAREGEYVILFCFVLFCFVLFFQIIIVITVMNYRSGNSQVVSNNHKIKYNLRRPENSQVFFWQEQK